MANQEKLIYNNLKDLMLLMGAGHGNRLHRRLFCYPNFPSQETFDGAIYVPGTRRQRRENVILFQPSTASVHSLTLHGFRMLFEALAESFTELEEFVRRVDRILFILVIPPYLADCSLKQPTYTPNASDATNRFETEILRKLDVYVVRLTRNGVLG
eukprot:gb/GECG01008670.1/.p1 GENE.gb/GECG01008670.1/~~gb/GECG01008670.1/.p1  ORF type:complete len:156 (+),score=13.20 gb/GECG01008670.1/:1-468(+)